MADGDPKKRGVSRRDGKADLRGASNPPKKTADGESESRPTTSVAPSTTGTDRAWKVAQLAATLATRYVVHLGQSNTSATNNGDWTLVRNEAAPELDGFYLSLLRRAEFLLAHGEARVGRVHASQLFDSTRRYSVKEITAEFRQSGWTGLTSENSIRSLLGEISDEMDRKSRAQVEHLVRFILDPQYLPHRRDTKLRKGERDKIEQEVSTLLEKPDSIKTHPKISVPIKEQVGLVRSRLRMIRDSLGQGGGESGVNAYAVFGTCADDGVLEEKLWRRRADLSRIYPL